MASPSIALAEKHRVLWPGRAVVLHASADAAVLDAELFFVDVRERDAAGRGAIGLAWTEPVDAAVVRLPKGKRRRDWFFAMAAAIAPRIVVVGAKSEGIKPAEKALASRGSVVGSAHGKKRRLAAVDVSPTPFDPDAWETRHRVRDLEVVALPGVFAESALSGGRLDDGTTLLLDALPKLEGRVLDLGCGAGAIGATVAAGGADVVLTDVDALAAESARRTLAANQLEGTVVLGDRYASTTGRFDAIVSNPPFHRGVGTEYETTRAIVREAPARLTPEGELWIVANRFLPWAETLEETFAEVETVRDDGRFRIYRATRPRVT